MKRIAIIILTIVSFSACEKNDLPKEAELMEYNSLLTQAGYEWFQVRYEEFQTNDSLLTLITENYNSDEHEFLFFVKPSCGCEGTQKIFPALVKILDEGGVSSENITFYSMGDEDYEHPYMNELTINDLPTAITLKNGVPVYSILDSISVLAAQGLDSVLYEHPILYSLQK